MVPQASDLKANFPDLRDLDMTRQRRQELSPRIATKGTVILERLIGEQAGKWTEEEASGIVDLWVTETPTVSECPDDQFGVYLELMKCRARMRLKSRER